METYSLFTENQHFIKAMNWVQLLLMELFQPSPCLCEEPVFLRLAPTNLPEVMPLCGLSARGWALSQRLAVQLLHCTVCGRLMCGAGEMSVGQATGFLRFPQYTRNHCAWTREDTDLPSFRPMTSGLHGPGSSRAKGIDLAPTPIALDQKPGSGRQVAP